jgi:hypothetical protein
MRSASYTDRDMRRSGYAWIVMLVACARSPEQTTTAPPPTTATTTPTRGTPVGVGGPNRGCKIDPAAEQACLARGSGFSYGTTPFIYCSGVAADTGALERQHAQAQQNQPCACNDERAIQDQLTACSMMPSAPGGAVASPSDPTAAGCLAMPQPLSQGKAGTHATVPPEDMVCAHGDTAYSCPATFEPRAREWSCTRSTSHRDRWCCPRPSP